MKLIIAKVDEVFFDGDAQSVTLPGASGELTVLGEHMPLVTTLKPGVVTVRGQTVPGGVQYFTIDGGILEVHREGATVIL